MIVCWIPLFFIFREDGVIIQHDLRNPHTCSSDNEKDRNILVDLRKYIGAKAEAKCLTVNPVRTEHIAVGANDPFVRVFDRRMIKIFEGNSNPDSERNCGAVQYFVPG
jgi:WD and tetratricopeptide repeat-containing protein 1